MRNLNLAIQQRRDALFGLLHDPENNLVGSILIHALPILVFFHDHAVADRQLLEFVRAVTEMIFAVRVPRAMLGE